MGTPCRGGNDCAVINTQRDIRRYTDQLRMSVNEAQDAMRMSQATSVAREAANRVLDELAKSELQVIAALAAKAKVDRAAEVTRDLGQESVHVRTHYHGFESRIIAMSLAAVQAADATTAAGAAAAASRAAARSHEGADASDVERARNSGEVRLIARMARQAKDALAIAEEDERCLRYQVA